MNNCLNCGKELTQTPGKKEKKYCDAKCKQKHWHKLKADKKDLVKISREEYEMLIKLNEVSIGFPYKRTITRDFNTNQPITKKVLVTKKVSGKPIIKELDKEGSKPYTPKEKASENLTYLQKRQQQKLK